MGPPGAAAALPAPGAVRKGVSADRSPILRAHGRSRCICSLEAPWNADVKPKKALGPFVPTGRAHGGPQLMCSESSVSGPLG